MDSNKTNGDVFDFDEEWDVEKVLQQRYEREQQEPERVIPQKPVQPAYQPAQQEQVQRPQRPASQNRSRNGGKKKKRVNWRGLAILIGGAIVLLALLIGLIVLIVNAIGGSDDPSKAADLTEAAEATEETLPPEERIADILERADFIAAGYDYDKAIGILQEFGTDWQAQPELSAANERYLAEKAKLVRYEDTTQITHIFFHSLIVDTDRAFDGDSKETGYNQYMATVTEFNRVLEELYKRNFVLVRIHDIVKVEKDENGKDVFKQGDIYLPPGKEPIVI